MALLVQLVFLDQILFTFILFTHTHTQKDVVLTLFFQLTAETEQAQIYFGLKTSQHFTT